MVNMSNKEMKKACETCGGTGQISFFKGVSRFLLSTEECQECAGTGLQLDEKPGNKKKRKKKK